jgi:Mg-chelatase subunit ChlD
MTLSTPFNNAAKQQQNIKTEDEIRTGVRKDSYGNTKFVRNGKIQRISWADGSRDAHGAEVKQNQLRQQAVAEKERRRELARIAKAPSPRAP